jgi:hypothetical protein
MKHERHIVKTSTGSFVVEFIQSYYYDPNTGAHIKEGCSNMEHFKQQRKRPGRQNNKK